jgi:hypothetical protein
LALSRDSRQEQKLKAIRFAQFRLKQRLEAIDWREDVLLPEIEALKSGRSVLGLSEGAAFDIEVVSENPNLPAPAARRTSRSRRRA